MSSNFYPFLQGEVATGCRAGRGDVDVRGTGVDVRGTGVDVRGTVRIPTFGPTSSLFSLSVSSVVFSSDMFGVSEKTRQKSPIFRNSPVLVVKTVRRFYSQVK